MDPNCPNPTSFGGRQLFPSTYLPSHIVPQNFWVHNQDSSIPPPVVHSSPDIASLSLESPRCPRCQGKKYGCTAYFHNKSIFPEPPHDLLPSIEESYAAKNRLKTLLLNYVLRTPERDQIHLIPQDLAAWEFQVCDLCYKLRDGTMFALSETTFAFEPLWEWVRDMVTRINKHICGLQRIDLSILRVKDVLESFKKLCEEVWRAWLRDRRLSESLALLA